MATTATIRIDVATKDRLTALAESRGVSVAQFVRDVVRDIEREEIFAEEREARRLDALNPEVREEDADWETTLEDGLD